MFTFEKLKQERETALIAGLVSGECRMLECGCCYVFVMPYPSNFRKGPRRVPTHPWNVLRAYPTIQTQFDGLAVYVDRGVAEDWCHGVIGAEWTEWTQPCGQQAWVASYC